MKILICFQSLVLRIVQTKISVLRILLQSSFFNVLKTNQIPSKPCLILGNGPSLNDTLAKTNPTLFEKFDAMAVNNAANSDEFIRLKPKLYILNAITYFQSDQELSDFYIDAKKVLFQSLKVKTSWKMSLLVPFRARKSREFNELLASNPNLTPLYFNQTPIEGLRFWSHLLFNLKLGMPRPHNVLIPGIMNAIHLRYSQIVIVGADHSWLSELSVNNKNEALLRHVHFYDSEGTTPMKMEDRITRPRKLHEIIQKFYLSFKGYWDISKYAKSRNVTIYNASTTSMIDAFERVQLDEFAENKP